MKRVIVEYSKLTGEILNLLVDKFPDGYDDSDIIRFKNAKNENIEAVEVRTVDTIFLVKISTKLSERIINYDEDDEIIDTEDVEDDSIDSLKDLEIDGDTADDDLVEKDRDSDDSDGDDKDSDDDDDQNGEEPSDDDYDDEE
jgi:DNA-directed RNA polymerase subunit delta